MLIDIDIDKIQVNNRIRKDLGNLEELAEDIKANTLLNALVVSPNGDGTYTLIAGERRLRAMRDILGYTQVTVNTVGVNDDEHALMLEISENECRKEFTKTERLDYARRLARIEAAKSQQGKRNDLAQDVVQSERNRSANAVAQALGTNRETIRQEQFIEDNRDLLDPADFADWDEGRLSTNKAYQRIKAAKEQAERDKRLAEQERDAAHSDLEEAYRDNELLEAEIASLKAQVAEKPEPEVVEREVVPDDYEAIKRRVHDLEHIERIHREDNQGLRKQLADRTDELEKARDILKINENVRDIRRDVTYLVQATNSYVRQYGGLTWTLQQLSEVDEPTLEQLRKAARNLATFASALVSNLETIEGR